MVSWNRSSDCGAGASLSSTTNTLSPGISARSASVEGPRHLRQAVGGLRGFEVVDGETDTGEAGGGRGSRPGTKRQRTQTRSGNRRCVTSVGPTGGQQLYGHRGSFQLVSGECRQTEGESLARSNVDDRHPSIHGPGPMLRNGVQVRSGPATGPRCG
jgi:hypothetical protein